MSDPLSGTLVASGGVVMAATGVVLFPYDAGTAYGAFAGAVLFVVSSTELSLVLRLIYLATSMLLGMVGGKSVADLVEIPVHWLERFLHIPTQTEIDPGLGAAICAAVIVNVLLWLIRQSKHPDRVVEKVFSGRERR